MTERRDRMPTGLALYLGVVQLFLLLGWTVYAIYLPGLLESVGIERRWTGWVLLADQVLFACFDIVAGLLADRAFRLYARIGYAVMGVTALSCLAFTALPLVPGLDLGPPVFLGLVALWAISSAALRSPLFALLARHAPVPAVPRLAGLTLAGMGLAAAASPYLGMLLSDRDPRLPFLLSSLALLLSAGGVVIAERRLTASPASPAQRPPAHVPAWGWVPAVLLAALAFQVAVFVNAGPRYLRELDAAWLPWLMPVFWVAFSLVVFAVGPLVKRWGAPWVFLLGCLAGAAGLAVTALPGIAAAVGGYVIAGAGWGAVLPSTFGLAAASGQPRHVGAHTGLLFAALAGAAFLRIGLGVGGWTKDQALAPMMASAPPLLWLCGGMLILLIHARLDRRASEPG